MSLKILIGVAVFFVQQCVCEKLESSMYYCAEMNPQLYVDIEQLMGMWYGIEVISHQSDARHEIISEEGCPVLYFSEDKTPTTWSPLHGNYNYNQYYGSGYGILRGFLDNMRPRVYDSSDEEYYSTPSSNIYNSDYQQYGGNPYQRQDQQQQNQQQNYQGNYNNRRYESGYTSDPRKLRYHEQVKRLRLLWDEHGVHTEYTMRYNVTKASVWFSSGPHNGSSLEPKFNSFAGTIQVLKAVGNHMVLLFCHQLPDRQLYSVLMSRVQNMSKHEIHGVHNLLQRRGLATTSIRRVCTSYSGSIRFSINYTSLIVLLITCSLVKSFGV